MFDAKALLPDLVTIARNLAPVVSHGAPEIIAAAKAAVSMLEKAKKTFGNDDQHGLQQALDTLRDEVERHAEQTIAKL